MSKKAEKYNTFGERMLTVADARQMGEIQELLQMPSIVIKDVVK